jgi:hypothetical protein
MSNSLAELGIRQCLLLVTSVTPNTEQLQYLAHTFVPVFLKSPVTSVSIFIYRIALIKIHYIPCIVKHELVRRA